MYKPHKIVIGIFLVYFFYALTSYFELGAFLAPFLFNKTILVFTSLFFLISHIRSKGTILLLVAFLAFLSEALVDEFTIRFLSMRLGFESFAVWSEDPGFIATTLIIFYGFIISSILLLNGYVKNWWLFILLLLMIGVDIILIIQNQPITRDVLLNVFFIFYFAIAIRTYANEKSILIPISALFLLHALLAIFKYVFVYAII
ncbi:hypothetical protein N8987_03175 [Crocinitomix sp.]|nr:hypothetical protein [Crocinitomix sp.]